MFSRFCTAAAVIALASAVPRSDKDAAKAPAWAAVSKALTAWEALSFDKQFGINLGDESGTIFTYQSKGFSMDDYRMAGASLSKWPSAVMISGMVADGTLGYDDKANKHLSWWSKDAEDPRSHVTLRSLLSFTSGLNEDPDSCLLGGFEYCAEVEYNNVKGRKYWQMPNRSFTYLSGHLQFAGAMAAAASKQPIQTLFNKYLYTKFNMTKTSYGPFPENPSMAAGITSTGADFENMLYRLLTHKEGGLPAPITTQMETDYTKTCDPSGDGWFGHYAMGHWWECLGYGTPSERSPLPPVCTDASIQAGPGEFGYYPLIDRSGGGGAAGPKRQPYYFQVPVQEPDALSGIPEYLRIVTKPLADLILAGQDPTTVDRKVILKNGGGLLARDITFIQGELGKCKCSGVQGKDEPYRTLARGLPEDEPKLNREAILAKGDALTLFEVAALQAKIGKCTCEGRKDAAVASAQEQ